MKTYDAIVIGTGQAGPTLSSRLAGAGYKTAVIERGKFGGTCVNTGCTPTKTMVASARAAYLARRGADFGVMIGGTIAMDMKRVTARADALVTKSNTGIEKWLTNAKNIDVYKGHAQFEGPHTVRVGDDVLEAERIYINVGTRPYLGGIDGIDAVDIQTNADMLKLDSVPEHLVVIGGSYVGLEFAQMYRRFGSKVSVVDRGPRLVKREDEDVSDAIAEIFESEGIDVYLNANCIAAEAHAAGVKVSLDCKTGPPELTGSHLLLAIGRVPNTDDLGLEKAGISTNERGFIEVDDQLQTNVPGVYALGDANGKGAFTHTSYNDHEIVADNLLDNDTRCVSDRIVTYGLFIDPPLARVGMTEREARDSGRPLLLAKRPMTKISRAVEKGETHGFIKVIVDKETEQILGAVILGVGGDEAIHSITDVMYAKAPYTVIRRAVHIHPTISELVPTVLGALIPADNS